MLFLQKNIEWEIMANHLFSNAVALIYFGLYFNCDQSRDVLDLGIKILSDEIEEQILKDGGHFELSPMYHRLMMIDLIGLLIMFNIFQLKKTQEIDKTIRSILPNMFKFLCALSHSDTLTSHFGDSVQDDKFKLFEIRNELFALGIDVDTARQDSIQHFAISGYSRLTNRYFDVIYNHANIVSSYQPGHAHADTLSVEISHGGYPIFVNSGTSTYAIGDVRSYERSTLAHNTLVFDGKNSTDVWGSFRVGRRAKIKKVYVNRKKGIEDHVMMVKNFAGNL